MWRACRALGVQACAEGRLLGRGVEELERVLRLEREAEIEAQKVRAERHEWDCVRLIREQAAVLEHCRLER